MPVRPRGSAAASHATADRLRAGLERDALAAAQPGRPGAWPRPPAPDEPLLGWLRELVHPGLYRPRIEQDLASRFGPDLFGLARLPPAPDFLAELDLATLAPEQVAPLLRRISLTRPTRPTPAETAPTALTADPGPISLAERTPAARRWGRAPDSDAPLLPATTRIPRIVHRVWLGGPVPASSAFLRNCAAVARAYRGELDVCLWTDVPRGTPSDLVGWARENGVLLVNVFEVFHAGNPMLLRVPFTLELSKQLPRGYAGACDHLRVEIMRLFGGAYVDGDIRLDGTRDGRRLPRSLPELFDAVAADELGFTLTTPPPGGIGNDMIIAPAGHPALRLWTELARVNYYRTQPQIFGGVAQLALPYIGEKREPLRYEAPNRSGRVHHTMLARLGVTRDDLVDTSTACEYGSELSWVPPRGGEPVARPVVGEQEIAATLRGIATFLAWQLHAREGNLYLAAAAPVVARLPDPDAAWVAVLEFLNAHRAALPEPTSITELRWNDDRGPEFVDLPRRAETLLDRAASPDEWLGRTVAQERSARLLDELVTPIGWAMTRDGASGPTAQCPDGVTLIRDASAAPAGIRLRSRDAEAVRTPWRLLDLPAPVIPDAALVVPAGYLGVQLEGRFGEAWLNGRRVHPEEVAATLREHVPPPRRPADPVPHLLAMSWGAANGPRSFAARLAALLGHPVHAPLGAVRIGHAGVPFAIPGSLHATTTAQPAVPGFLCFAPTGEITPSGIELHWQNRAGGLPRCLATR